MTEMLRKEVAAAARTIVVKVGTRVVTGANGHLDDVRIAQLAEQLNELVSQGRRVVLVSSGAVYWSRHPVVPNAGHGDPDNIFTLKGVNHYYGHEAPLDPLFDAFLVP